MWQCVCVCVLDVVLVHMVLLLQVNIIPKWVNFTVDVRCQRNEFRQKVVAAIQQQVEAICASRGVNCTVTRTHDAAPVSFVGGSDRVQEPGVRAGGQCLQG